MATTDSPVVFWIACALYFSIRIAQTGDIRDSLWAGFFSGWLALPNIRPPLSVFLWP